MYVQIALNIFVGSTHKGSSYIHKYSVLITYVVRFTELKSR